MLTVKSGGGGVCVAVDAGTRVEMTTGVGVALGAVRKILATVGAPEKETTD
jgi:hypothetical protein